MRSTSRSSVPLKLPSIILSLLRSGHGGRKTFLVIEEGYLDNQEGYWVELVVSGAFPRKENERGFKGQRKVKGKGRKGSRGRRFFKKRKGRSNLAENNTEAWQAEGQWHDESWQESSWDDWPWDYAEESYAAKAKVRKERRAKAKMEKME